MANEIQVTAILSYTNAAKAIAQQLLSIVAKNVTIAGWNYAKGVMTVPVLAGGTAIPVSLLGTLGLCIIKNNDTTNFVTILNAVSGTQILKIPAGEVFIGRLDPAIVAPAALANTAPADIEFLILEP